MAKCGDVVINRLDNATMTIRVRVSKRFSLRCFIAIQLMRLAGYIMPTCASVEVDNASD